MLVGLGFPSRGMKTLWTQIEVRDGMRWLDGVIDSVDIDLSELGETVKNRKVWRAAVRGVAESVLTW